MSNLLGYITRFCKRIARRHRSRRTEWHIQTTIAVPPFVKVTVDYASKPENDNPKPSRRRKTG